MQPNDLILKLSLSLMRNNSMGENAKSLYNLLSEYIPFQQILVFMHHKKTGIFTPLVFLIDGNIVPVFDNKKVTFTEEFEHVAKTQRVFFINDVQNHQGYAPFLNLYYSGRRSILIAYTMNNEEFVAGITLLSVNTNQYTEEHCEIINSIFSLITELTENIFTLQSNPQTILETKDQSSLALLQNCKGMRPIISEIEKISDTDYPILIRGETGVGKEIVADAIHYLSKRKFSPFVKVNCAAISESLLESELFGHEKGAFTSATGSHKGYFEQAQNGTIFLDEIGELSPAAQAKLLRVIENNEIRRIGGTQSISINVRIIAATHQNIEKRISENTFRLDLWYRLAVFVLNIPPLRMRKEDIKTLAEHIYYATIKSNHISNPPALTTNFLTQLYKEEWLGNARELKHAIERALILGQGEKEMNLKHASKEKVLEKAESAQGLNDLNKQFIEEALAKCNGRIQGEHGAAKMLNINPNTLRSRMLKLGIKRK